MGPHIQRQHTRIQDAEIGDRVRYVADHYPLHGRDRPDYDYLVSRGQTGEITAIESGHIVHVQWDHHLSDHHSFEGTRRGPQRIDRTGLELI